MTSYPSKHFTGTVREIRLSYPRILYTNIRSLLPKIEETRILCSLKKPDVVCITETWLDSSVDSSLIHISGYSLCRNDRKDRRGGGVAVYIRNEIVFDDVSSLVTSCSNGIEISVVHLPLCHVFMFLAYIPPCTKADVLKKIHNMIVEMSDDLLTRFSNHHLVILGDFNHFNFNGLCQYLDLVDLVKDATRKDSILDHVLVSSGLAEVYVPEYVNYDAPVGTSDHVTILVTPKEYAEHTPKKRLHVVFDYRKSNLEALNSRASQVEWNDIINPNEDVDILCSKFHSVISELISEVIPKKRVWMSSSDKELTKLH